MSASQADVARVIRSQLKDRDDWARLKTSIPGVFVVKIPDSQRFHVMLWFCPPDEQGNPRKKKGLYFDDQDSARAARKAFSDEGLMKLVEAIRAINSAQADGSAEDEPVIQL